jgi:hypothetical protein
MLKTNLRRIFALGALACLAATPVAAQKSKDTIRIAVATNIPLLSIYEFAQPDADFFYRELYDNLATASSTTISRTTMRTPRSSSHGLPSRGSRSIPRHSNSCCATTSPSTAATR